MKKITFLGVLAMLIIGIYSCTSTELEKKEKEVITQKIMYDVPIVNPNIISKEDFKRDWFWKNIPESDLDRLLIKLYDNVISGETQAYVYDAIDTFDEFEKIPKENVKKYSEEEWFMYETIQEEDADGNIIEIRIPTLIEKKQIEKLRFLEEWYYEGDEFCKRVIAVAPIFVNHASDGLESINIFYWVDIKDVE